MKTNTILQGNAFDLIKMLPDDSIDCVVTSPPYWGLRDYGTAKWEGGDPNCSHVRESKFNDACITGHSEMKSVGYGDAIYKDVCKKCGAVRVDSQFGLEPTPDEYLEKLLTLFDDIRRVLKPSGVIWVNLADTYSGSGCGTNDYRTEASRSINKTDVMFCKTPPQQRLKNVPRKSLCCIPFRFAWEMVQRGWILRQDVIWAKPNPMPESVKDRCTRAHEYIFMFAKSADYYYDYYAIKEPSSDWESYAGRNFRSHKKLYETGGWPKQRGYKTKEGEIGQLPQHHGQDIKTYPTRNKRSVWWISTKPYKGAHFATFPEDLIEPMILAGCPEHVCAKCGMPRERILKPTEEYAKKLTGTWAKNTDQDKDLRMRIGFQAMDKQESCCSEYETAGWTDCGCGVGWKRGVVLDPFMGSGTVAAVALKNGRDFLGFELNPSYIEMAYQRIEQYDTPIFRRA